MFKYDKGVDELSFQTMKLKESIERKEYIVALRSYFQKTQGEIPISLSRRVENEIGIIKGYERYTYEQERGQAKIHMVATFLLILLSSIATAVTIIWALNEVLDLAVSYSSKNVLILSLIFFINKSGVGIQRALTKKQ